jgi:hypothetical protein
MKQYVLSTYQPDAAPPGTVDMDRIARDVAALQKEMRDAGVCIFTDHLQPASSATATVVRAEGDRLVTTDGPYARGNEHVGGLSIIKVPDLDAAREWAAKMARATTLPIEVRPFMGEVED